MVEAQFLKTVDFFGGDPEKFLLERRDWFNEQVEAGNALWFRRFPIGEVSGFARLMKVINPRFVPYTGAKVRQAAGAFEHLYRPTSTPRFRKNFLHNEMAYQKSVPRLITFFSEQPSPIGGESLLGDQRRVYMSLSPRTRAAFEKRKLRFVRVLVNQSRLHAFLTKHLDMMAIFPSWQTNFASQDQKAVEAKCRAAGFEVDWTDEDDLMISCVIDPVKPHPLTGEPMWVNNAHLFQLHKDVYGRALYGAFIASKLFMRKPMTLCYYGDGEPIEPHVVKFILNATEENEVVVRLERGEFIYAHNWAVSHGRTPFKGLRKLYFGLLDSANNAEPRISVDSYQRSPMTDFGRPMK